MKISSVTVAYKVLTILVVTVLLLVVIFTIVMYPNWIAQRRANAFCESIAIGSDIAAPVQKMEVLLQPHHYWLDDKKGYRFVFRGLVVDFAYCEVALNQHGKVIAKHSAMVYD